MTERRTPPVLTLGDVVEDIRSLPAGKRHGAHSRGLVVALAREHATIRWEPSGIISSRPLTLLRRVEGEP